MAVGDESASKGGKDSPGSPLHFEVKPIILLSKAYCISPGELLHFIHRKTALCPPGKVPYPGRKVHFSTVDTEQLTCFPLISAESFSSLHYFEKEVC